MEGSTRVPATTIGVDVSDRTTHLCVLDANGEVVEESRIPTREPAILKRFGGIGRARVVLEVGPHSPWMSRAIASVGHEVIVANPRKLRLIYENDRKTDRTDAEYMARVGRMDPALLSPVVHRGETAQADLAAVRSRSALVEARTALINHARSTVKALGGRLPKCSTDSFHWKVEEHVPEALQAALLPVLDAIRAITAEIDGLDRWIDDLSENEYPETALLRQVAGVGQLTALCFVLTLEDPTRFPTSRAVGPYLGLVTRLYDSGESSPQLRTTKAGDALLRSLLVQSAHYVLGPFGPDCDLRRWGEALVARGGKNAKKKAVVAVARKLAVLLHRLWITAEVYEPLRGHPAQEAARKEDMPARDFEEQEEEAIAA